MIAFGVAIASTHEALAQESDHGRFPPHDGSFGVIIENDAFGDGSDDNYSNGLQLNMRADFDDAPASVRWLGRRFADLNDMEPESFGLAIGHLIYTPTDIDASVPPGRGASLCRLRLSPIEFRLRA